ncbi:MAG: sensor histidine kinase, partial [Rhodospirillales bacterium]
EREENIFGRTYLTLKFPIVDHGGHLLGLGGIETDVTELKKADKDLRNAKEQAEFANRAKTEFLANMSHELRTPLNSILGFSEVLMSETLGPVGNQKYQEYAEDIHVSGNHLLSLIGEVLDLSKLEAGEFRIVESEIDVADAVKSCIRMIEGRATAETAPVKARFANGLPPMLGDERRFKQIILNLLGNAVKFTPPEGEIRVAARIGDCGRFTIEVADTGVGIAAEDIPKVMEPFGQARDVLTRNYEGTGLGLYLAKSLTALHGGTLDIASEVGRGTTVTLRFPKDRILPCAQKKRRRAR